jgi:Fe2+ transport system protein FeoA
MRTLADLTVGEVAVVKDLNFDDLAYVKRLQALGLRTGAEIKVIRKGLTGSPIHVSIRTTELAIRQKDAENIHIF